MKKNSRQIGSFMSIDQAKKQAKNLKLKAKELGLNLSHSNALELISSLNGFKDWNSYVATEKPTINVECTNYLPYLKLINDINELGGLSIGQIQDLMSEKNYESIDSVADLFERATEEYENYQLELSKKNNILFKNEIKKSKFNIYEFELDMTYWIMSKSEKDAILFINNKLICDGVITNNEKFEKGKELSMESLEDLTFHDDMTERSFLEEFYNRIKKNEEDTSIFALSEY